MFPQGVLVNSYHHNLLVCSKMYFRNMRHRKGCQSISFLSVLTQVRLNCYILYRIFTGRNEVLAKVIFLQSSVCPQGGIPACLASQSQGGLRFWGSPILGGLQFWGSPIFRRGLQFWGVSNFSGVGSPEYGQCSAGTHSYWNAFSCYLIKMVVAS